MILALNANLALTFARLELFMNVKPNWLSIRILALIAAFAFPNALKKPSLLMMKLMKNGSNSMLNNLLFAQL